VNEEEKVMAMAPAPAPAVAPHRVGDVEVILGQLEVIRAEAQDWLRSVKALEQLSKITDADSRANEITSNFRQEKTVIEDNVGHLQELVGDLERRIETDPFVAKRMGDELTNITNALKRATFLWTSLLTDAPRGDALVLRLAPIGSELENAVWRCGFLTIPDRVSEHLRDLRIGQGLDFTTNFKDELPRDSDRATLLTYLYDHPAAVPGVVDVGKGKIFKASRNPLRRAESIFLVTLCATFDFVALWIVARWVTAIAVPGTSTTTDRWSVLWKILAALLAGSIAHIAVSAIKQSRDRRGDQAFLAMDDLFLWIHVREVQLSLSVVSYLIGVLGIILVLKKTDVVTAFFVGYSFDSFVDIFLERFDNAATAQMTSLTGSAAAA
jgi:hypothetical protein